MCLFQYNTAEEARSVKDRISALLLGQDENVVSVFTEREKQGCSTIWSVKIGLKNMNKEITDNILDRLRKSNWISENIQHGDTMLTPFVTEAPIHGL